MGTGMAGMGAKDGYTADALFGGRILCTQRAEGYRFSLDAVLLGNFISLRPGERILDMGCGSGIISLILAYRWHNCQLTGIEIQPELVELAAKNVADNNWQKRIEILQGDLRHIEKVLPAGEFDWVVSNPPYWKTGSGRTNLEPEQLVARHEIFSDVNAVTKASVWALKNKGRAAFVYPAERGATVLYEMKKQGLEPKRMQVVYSYPGSAATLLLVEAIKGGGEKLTILSPFYVYRENGGEYSPEMEACYRP
jgi:tRNA1Val (adenine37-N6)-methyltransferase